MLDTKDEYIRTHYGHMSLREMAVKLGIDKSTVSRRLNRLRESGDIDEYEARAAKDATSVARSSINRGMTANDRLAALLELKDCLQAELQLVGGAGLARVSSEYRRTLEEVEALSATIRKEAASIPELTPLEVLRIQAEMVEKIENEYDFETIEKLLHMALSIMHEMKLVKVTPVTIARVRAKNRNYI